MFLRQHVTQPGTSGRQEVTPEIGHTLGNLAKTGNTFVVPPNLADLTSMMALATDIAKGRKGATEAS